MTSAHSDMPPQHPLDEDDDLSAPHKPADDREVVYYNGAPMIRGEMGRVLGFGLVGLLFIAAPIVYRILNRDHTWWPALVNLALIVIGIILWSIPWIMTKSLRYRISNYRIDYERGWLSKNIDTLELWHVEDIQFHQSFSDRLLGVGTIVVISHDDTTPRLELMSIPNPRPIFETLKQRIIAVKRQRGVVKMDIGT